MCYGQTRDEAVSNAERLAIEVIADRIAHGELSSSALGVQDVENAISASRKTS
jgi:hypothetical protein